MTMLTLPNSIDRIAIDYETIEILPDGSTAGSTEAYRANFRVDSAAFTWHEPDGLKSKFIKGESAVGAALAVLAERRVPIIAHNIQFEMLVTRCRYPGLQLNWHADTMRLVQVYDNGGDKFAFEKIETLDDLLDQAERMVDEEGAGKKKKKKAKIELIGGLGLVKAVKRLLPKEFHDHKKEAHDWIRANVPECPKGKEGAFLHRLPDDIAERYNVGDTENTMRLYDFTTTYFKSIKYDWTFDHRLFFSSVHKIVEAKIRGVKVDREKLAAYREEVAKEIELIAAEFRSKFLVYIEAVERGRLLEEVRARKTLRGRKKYIKRVRADIEKWNEDVRFNVGSNKQLAALFIDKLGIQPKFFTDKGAPSFKSSMLDQWGDGGNMLKKRRKRMLVLKQSESLFALTEYDGRWHVDIKAAGPATGRFAAGQH